MKHISEFMTGSSFSGCSLSAREQTGPSEECDKALKKTALDKSGINC